MTGLLRSPSFRHGVHPAEQKDATQRLQIERMPFVAEYVLPLSQHAGKPSRPIVQPGQRVERGQMIGEPDGFISTALHAPAAGTIRGIEMRPHPNGQRLPAIVLDTDPFSGQLLAPELRPPDPALPAAEIVTAIQRAGIVGLGGAAFPTHVKLLVPEGRRVRFVVLNGCECEPYLTCDQRTMVEYPRQILRGLDAMVRIVGAERSYIGIEANKPDAIAALRQAAGTDRSPEIISLAVKYPQGAEKMLIDAVFAREVPSGKLPLDVEIVVQNVGTATAIANLLDSGCPLIERVVTVTGPGIRRPANLLVPIGTPLSAILEHCGGVDPATREVILGGPMMGLAQKRLDVPMLKGASGILALTGPAPLRAEQPCIRCGRCLEACPMFLNPSRLAALARHEDAAGLQAYHVLDCFECASCSFVCPSYIPLVQLMRVGKAILRQKATA